jgi:hypothetical protein
MACQWRANHVNLAAQRRNESVEAGVNRYRRKKNADRKRVRIAVLDKDAAIIDTKYLASAAYGAHRKQASGSKMA